MRTLASEASLVSITSGGEILLPKPRAILLGFLLASGLHLLLI